MRPFAGHDPVDDLSGRRINRRQIIRAHVRHQNALLVPKHTSRRRANRFNPKCGQRRQIKRREFAGSLQRYKNGLRIRREIQVTRHGSDGEPFQQLHGCRIVDIDLIPGQPVYNQKFSIWTEPEMIGIRDHHPALYFPRRGIKIQDLIA